MYQLSEEQNKIIIEIFLISSQVTFGVAFATLLFPPLDGQKLLAILVSGIITIVLWVSAFIRAKKI
ncbi:MAG: hypothetical protein Q8L37_00275 [Candidatus Gottesmanbacteria bacterium]|nr:hypothetical protein [Candidatus Gottesmanbacteria bacterium]